MVESPRKIGVIIPCYKEKAHILDVLSRIGPEVCIIVIVDDACPDRTGSHVEHHCSDPRVSVLFNHRNLGVGGATLRGMVFLAERGIEVFVKIDGDGQMDPKEIQRLAAPILSAEADYVKGNRFYFVEHISAMPVVRRLGNIVLSFVTKLSTGYWNIFDPTNGFVAIHRLAFSLLPLNRISKDFFFESSILYHLYLTRAVVTEIPMIPRYFSEQSKLKPHKVIIPFIVHHLVNSFSRIVNMYFLRDFNMASLYLIFGIVFLAFGSILGLIHWFHSVTTGIVASSGTVMLAALPIMLGFQCLLGFFNLDVASIPKEPLCKKRL